MKNNPSEMTTYRDPMCDAEHQKPPLGECTCDAYTRGFFDGGGCVCKFDRGYAAGYKEAEKYYTNTCFSCGYAGEWSTYVCDECIESRKKEDDGV